MTEILDGKIAHNELTVNAFGGTELVAERLVSALPPQLLDGVQIISSRVRHIDHDKYLIYHVHDMESDPECHVLSDVKFRSTVDKIVFVSQWQAERFVQRFDLKYEEWCVIPNPIEPFKPLIKPGDKTRLIYHTTPHRGLELLVPVFIHLFNEYQDIELDVFSSFQAYGWSERDKQYEDVFNKCREHPAINYHGFQPNHIVRQALEKAHIFAYPCIWPETSCLALIEALAAGCYAVHPNFGALPETAKGMSFMYQQSSNHAKILKNFTNKLASTVELSRESPLRPSAQQFLFNGYHGIDNVAEQWVSLLQEIKD